MLKRFGTNFAVFLFLSDLVLTTLLLHLARLVRPHLPWGLNVGARGELLHFSPALYLIVPTIWALTFLFSSVYDPERTLRWVDDVQTVAVAIGIATLVFAGLAYFFYRDLSRFLFVTFFVFDEVGLIAWRLFLRVLIRLRRARWPHPVRQVLVVGAGKVGLDVARQIEAYRWAGLELVGFLDDDPDKRNRRFLGKPVLGGLEQVAEVVKQHHIDEIVIALPLRAHKRMVDLILTVQRLPVSVRVVPDLFDLAFFRATVEEFGGMPLIGLRDPAIDEFQRLVKRLFDLALGSVLLVLAAPVMAAIAIAIKLDSPGPVIFKQQRVGEGGKLFTFYKFRSMYVDAEERLQEVIHYTDDGKVLFKRRDDPRVTRVGRFIRATSLDELPQLFNVLKGDMSLVGPRPELPWLVDRYEPWQLRRFAVPQGITGWWQVNGRSNKPMHLHTEDDLYYIQHYSLWLDIKILWMTIGAVLRRVGAF